MARAVNAPIHARVGFLVVLAHPEKHCSIAALCGCPVTAAARGLRRVLHYNVAHKSEGEVIDVLYESLIVPCIITYVCHGDMDVFFSFCLQGSLFLKRQVRVLYIVDVERSHNSVKGDAHRDVIFGLIL